MKKVQLLLIGGFLGAGKTTLIGQVARKLQARGQRIGLITNDQAADLVDTAWLRETGAAVSEIAGGCFCCRFDELIQTASRLISDPESPDLLIGEPVGSCTDLQATVLNPVRQIYGDRFGVLPLSIVIDPERLHGALGNLDPESEPDPIAYIYAKQIEEADVVILNKIDRCKEDWLVQIMETIEQFFPGRPVFKMSALEDRGIDEWLEWVLSTEGVQPRKTMGVDYQTYAEGEAALGWLNLHGRLEGGETVDWQEWLGAFLTGIQEKCRNESREIAHVKAMLTGDSGSIMANLTDYQNPPQLQGTIRGTGRSTVLTLNARVVAAPEWLESCIREALAQTTEQATIEFTLQGLESLSPAPPQPMHREIT